MPSQEEAPRHKPGELAIFGNRGWARRTLLLCAVFGASCALPVAAVASGPRAQVTRVGSAPGARELALVLPLKADLAGLQRFATAVTTIGSPRYGAYLPIAALARRFGASASERSRVLRYLRHEGAREVRIDVTGLFAEATMKVSLAQRLFGTALERYQDARAARFIAPATAARIPAPLSGAVTGVVGLDTRPVFAAPRSIVAAARGLPRTSRATSANRFPSGYGQRTGSAAGCPAAIADRGFTPNQYLTAYDYAPLQAAGVSGQDERVALIEIDGFRSSDVRTFANCFDLAVPTIHGFGVGIKRLLPPGGETTLDLELLDSTAPGLSEVDVYESAAQASDVLQSLTAPLRRHGHVPDVISVSLGTCEPALEATIGSSGAHAAQGALALAAASGISVLASSGDAGSSACIGADGPLDRLAVSYPASSPLVTAIGGTNVNLTAANQIQAQTVWNDAPVSLSAGGGGLSTMFKRPAYQDGFVSHDRRAVPDVSMLADVLPGYDIYCTARECLAGGANPWIAVGGTSAAAPLFAGGLALTDQVLREHGKQNVGLANSLLYEIAGHFASTGAISDVISNDNDLGPFLPNGNRRPLGCCSAGRGYDFASGLGSVDLYKFALLATALQPPIARISVSLPPQRPVQRHRLLARLFCSGRCIAAAVASVTVSGAPPFVVGSGNAVLRGKGSKIVALRFSQRELTLLRAALRAHRAIGASVVGQVLDPGGSVEASSAPRGLRIMG